MSAIIRDKETKLIIKDISLQENVSYSIAEKIFTSQFKFAKEMIRSAHRDKLDTFKSSYHIYFGKFAPNKYLTKKINKMREENEE